nr:hypothetical protein [uncultured Oscillibacter sp.]
MDLSQVGSAIGLILVVIVASVITQGSFLSASNLTNIFRQVTIMGFASLGMCIVIITGNIDLSIIGNVTATPHPCPRGAACSCPPVCAALQPRANVNCCSPIRSGCPNVRQ